MYSYRDLHLLLAMSGCSICFSCLLRIHTTWILQVCFQVQRKLNHGRTDGCAGLPRAPARGTTFPTTSCHRPCPSHATAPPIHSGPCIIAISECFLQYLNGCYSCQKISFLLWKNNLESREWLRIKWEANACIAVRFWIKRKGKHVHLILKWKALRSYCTIWWFCM